jgi:hypothetical protein
MVSDDTRRLSVSFDVAWYDRIDTLPWAQNVATDFSNLLSGEIGLRYADLRRPRGAAFDESGVRAEFVVTGNRASGQITPRLRGIVDYGVELPLLHSSVWLRSAGGIASGGGNATIAKSYFGSFGNNYVDNGPVRRYRDWNSFPGFGIEEISALDFVREMVEWNLSPIDFASLGTPALYAKSLQPSVFAAGLWMEPGSAAQRKGYASVGAQADLRLGVLHWYEMTLSVGFAAGYRGGQHAGNEWMVSLKIM